MPAWRLVPTLGFYSARRSLSAGRPSGPADLISTTPRALQTGGLGWWGLLHVPSACSPPPPPPTGAQRTDPSPSTPQPARELVGGKTPWNPSLWSRGWGVTRFQWGSARRACPPRGNSGWARSTRGHRSPRRRSTGDVAVGGRASRLPGPPGERPLLPATRGTISPNRSLFKKI